MRIRPEIRYLVIWILPEVSYCGNGHLTERSQIVFCTDIKKIENF